MDSIVKICVPSTFRAVTTLHTEVLTIILDLTPDILKQFTFHNRFTILREGLIVYENRSREIYYIGSSEHWFLCRVLGLSQHIHFIQNFPKN